MTKHFYVLCVRNDPWVLGGFDTLQRAKDAIRWQIANRLWETSDWAIAQRTGQADFVTYEDTPRSLTVERGPYTKEAFEKFKNEWV